MRARIRRKGNRRAVFFGGRERALTWIGPSERCRAGEIGNLVSRLRRDGCWETRVLVRAANANFSDFVRARGNMLGFNDLRKLGGWLSVALSCGEDVWRRLCSGN